MRLLRCLSGVTLVGLLLISTMHIALASQRHSLPRGPSVAPTQPASSVPDNPIPMPTPPTLVALPVVYSRLSATTVKSDVQAVDTLMAAHRGDGQTYGPDHLVYRIDSRINPSLHEVGGQLQLALRNNLDAPIRMLYFNVWPDAPHYRWRGGYTTVTNVTIDGISAAAKRAGTLLQISLPTPLSVGRQVTVAMAFLSKLPHLQDRYGWSGTNLTLGNWFPVLAVHDANGWITPPYDTDGESFYSLTGVFHLNMTAPQNLVIASTGQTTAPPSNAGNGWTTTHIVAVGVRDAALVADSAYRATTAAIDGVGVTVYYEPTEATQVTTVLTTAKAALSSFDNRYGQYPYRTLSLCLVHGDWGGMEYPQLAMISVDPAMANPATLRSVVAHEIAHQWFYGLVGDDQFLNPWVDEAFATFAENRLDGTLDTLPSSSSSVRFPSDPVFAFPSSDFPNASTTAASSDYGTVVYEQGAAVLNSLMRLMDGPASGQAQSATGVSPFDKMMRAYVAQYAYQVATTQDFSQFVNAFTGRDFAAFFLTHGINPAKSASAAMQAWATLEEAQNGRNWH